MKVTDDAHLIGCGRSGVTVQWFLHGGSEFKRATFRPEHVREISHRGRLLVTRFAAQVNGLYSCPEVRVFDPGATVTAVRKQALYFGYLDDAGHFLHGLRSRYGEPQKQCPSFPWTLGNLDTGLLKNGKIPDTPDGRVHWTCGGKGSLWHAFFWWDRSGDKRANSNSGFYVEGFTLEQRDEAFAFACGTWPEVVARQHHPLVLVP